jgi:hypothetical protein
MVAVVPDEDRSTEELLLAESDGEVTLIASVVGQPPAFDAKK